MKIRFSLFSILLTILFICVYLAGYQSGQTTGMETMHKIGTRIEVLASVEHKCAPNKTDLFVQRSFVTNDGETYKLACPELNDLFLEITTTRADENGTDSATATKGTVIQLKNVSVLDVKKHLEKTMPQLCESDVVVFDAATNSVKVNNHSAELLANIAALIKFTDKPSVVYQAKIRIGRTMPDGTQVILSEPTIHSIQKMPGRITIGNPHDRISVNLTFDDLPLSNF